MIDSRRFWRGPSIREQVRDYMAGRDLATRTYVETYVETFIRIRTQELANQVEESHRRERERISRILRGEYHNRTSRLITNMVVEELYDETSLLSTTIHEHVRHEVGHFESHTSPESIEMLVRNVLDGLEPTITYLRKKEEQE